MLTEPNPLLTPVSYSTKDLPIVTGLKPRAINQAVISGELPSKRIGRSRIVMVEDLRKWMAAAPPTVETEAARIARQAGAAKSRARLQALS